MNFLQILQRWHREKGTNGAEAEPILPCAEPGPGPGSRMAWRRWVVVFAVGAGVLVLAGAGMMLPGLIQESRRETSTPSVPVLSTRSLLSVEGAGPDPGLAAGMVPDTPGEATTDAAGEQQEYPEMPSETPAAGGGEGAGRADRQGEDEEELPETGFSQINGSLKAADGEAGLSAGPAAGKVGVANPAGPAAGRPAVLANLSAHRSPSSSSSPPRLAVVIDDWGYDRPGARQILSLRVPLTAAVLPFAPLTREQAEAARQAGFEVILHMPMEPFDASIPLAAEALRTGMSEETVKELVRQALRAVPQAVGISNHQGSRATSDARVMRAVLEVVKQEGLFFLDSRTSSRSVALAVARQLGVPAAANRLFIDNDDDVAAIEARLWEAAELARREGHAIVIGHVYSSTAIALARTLPELQKAGIELVTVSSLINPDGQQWTLTEVTDQSRNQNENPDSSAESAVLSPESEAAEGTMPAQEPSAPEQHKSE
ncbi:MAG: divergent polysaccharide deacetylase family protein [Limnochordales bacterium]|nr:divergent polysaccharide deacetylase family protein [Limnochordales bacterium]